MQLGGGFVLKFSQYAHGLPKAFKQGCNCPLEEAITATPLHIALVNYPILLCIAPDCNGKPRSASASGCQAEEAPLEATARPCKHGDGAEDLQWKAGPRHFCYLKFWPTKKLNRFCVLGWIAFAFKQIVFQKQHIQSTVFEFDFARWAKTNVFHTV